MEEERFNYSTNDATRFVDELKDRVHELYDENKRLNNIINELEDYMIGKDIYKILLYKLRDLKESDKE